jgi:hypothetical protein
VVLDHSTVIFQKDRGIYEHIRYENNDFMSQICEKNNSKVRFVESSFGQCIEIENHQ